MNRIITAQCRVITPMLASGAAQQHLEIRATEVKQGLRFWWRAFQPLKGQELFEREKELFGSTERAAPFGLSVQYGFSENDIWKPGDTHGWGLGLQYIFFATNLPSQKAQPAREGKPARAARNAQIKGLKDKGRSILKPDEGIRKTRKFTLRIRCERLDTKQTGDILCALWLLENLGGIGGRTRRGAGCFEIEELKFGEHTWNAVGEETRCYGTLPSFALARGQKASDFLQEGLKIIQNRWGNGFTGTIFDHTSFYNPGKRILMLGLDLNSASHVLEQVGLWFKEYCYKNPLNEAQTLHQALVGSMPPSGFTLSKAARGLPIIYNFTGTRDKYTATFDDGGKDGRRASPLMISCHERGGKGYAVVCYFPAQFLPAGKHLELKPVSQSGSAWKGRLPAPGQNFIEEMFDKPRTKADGTSVSPLCSGNWCDALSTQSAAVGVGKVPRPPQPDLAPAPHQLLRSIENARRIDEFKIERIINDLDSMDDEQVKSRIAVALKEKIKADRQLWKKFGKEIETYIS